MFNFLTPGTRAQTQSDGIIGGSARLIKAGGGEVRQAEKKRDKKIVEDSTRILRTAFTNGRRIFFTSFLSVA